MSLYVSITQNGDSVKGLIYYHYPMPVNLFLNLAMLFGLTVTIAVIIRLLRQPLLVAYLVAGIIAGPLFLNLVDGGEQFFQSFAQLGVVLLLFLVGLSLNVTHVKRIANVAFKTGAGQLVFTALLGLPILVWLGYGLRSALYLAVAITFSSTIIVIKLLADKKALETVYGKHTVGLLLVQDIIATAILVVLTNGSSASPVWWQAAVALIVKIAVLLLLVYALSKIVLPLFLDRIAASGEFLFLFTIAWCFGIASAVAWSGFSIEIGAIVAGLSLGSSPYQLEIMSRLKPLRDFFIVLFFIILGSELQLANVAAAWPAALALSLFIIIGNPLILYFIYRSQKFTRRNSFLASTAAAQVSEFGFILIFTGRELGHLVNNELTVFTLTALITIVVSTYILTYNDQLYQFFLPFFRLFGKDAEMETEKTDAVYDAWVVGYHRIGWKICEALRRKHLSFAVIDYNPAAIAKLKRRGIPAYFGDISDVEFLRALPLEQASLIIMTVPEPEPQMILARHVRKDNKKAAIIANLSHNSFLSDLYAAGASYVMMPHLLGGTWMAEILTKKPWTKRTFEKMRAEQKKDMTLRTSDGHA